MSKDNANPCARTALESDLKHLLKPSSIQFDANEMTKRITVTIDDELFHRAMEVADSETDGGDLFREAMKAIVRVQARKRLAALGGKRRG